MVFEEPEAINFLTENDEDDFNFIDPSILKQFKRTSISIEKIQKEILNFDDKGSFFWQF